MSKDEENASAMDTNENSVSKSFISFTHFCVLQMFRMKKKPTNELRRRLFVLLL